MIKNNMMQAYLMWLHFLLLPIRILKSEGRSLSNKDLDCCVGNVWILKRGYFVFRRTWSNSRCLSWWWTCLAPWWRTGARASASMPQSGGIPHSHCPTDIHVCKGEKNMQPVIDLTGGWTTQHCISRVCQNFLMIYFDLFFLWNFNV